MSKTTNKFSPEVRDRAVRLVLDNEGQHGSRWQAIMSISAKIGCSAHTLNEWVKKVEVFSGKRAGVSSEMAERMKALERENRELRQANEILCKAIMAELIWGRRERRDAKPKPPSFNSSTASTTMPPAFSTGRQEAVRLRTESGSNEHLERQQYAPGPVQLPQPFAFGRASV